MALEDLSSKQKGYVKGRAAGKSKRQAALDAGYTPQTADNAKYGIENSADVRREFQRLIRAKVTAERISQRLSEGLDAEETKFFQKDGNVIEQHNVIAWSERRAYAELCAQYGDFFTPKQELEIVSDDREELRQLLITLASTKQPE